MALDHFCQMYLAFDPECGDSIWAGDKCYQLRYYANHFNYKARNIFFFGRDALSDEGGIPMRSHYCPVQQYNKDTPD
eukprot:14160273-Ditylum_brightwellii.AAC.2